MTIKYAVFIGFILVPMLSIAFGDDKPKMTQDQFLNFLAKGLLENKDHCPDRDELSQEQKKTLVKFGEQIMKDDTGFRNELQTKLKAKNPSIVLKKLDDCPDEIAARGPQYCYSVKSGTRKITDFSVGPYDAAGINCTKIQDEAKAIRKNPSDNISTSGSP